MESYFPIGGFQLPFQRRLSRLYNDTKKSTDFVKEPVQNAEDPEIKALHRKLRIQKDRLVSWGLEWSDPSQSAEVLIDSSLSKAGLSEVVGSIMSTIKDILAEAEPLWLSSKRLVGEKEPEKSPADRKLPLVAWDKGRFEDLVRDLTTSIDTLYDLSRTRSSAVTSSQAARARLTKSGSSMEDLRPFESTRMQTPRHIDPQTLTDLQSMQAEPMTDMPPETTRRIVFMSKQAFSDLTRASGRQQYSPLLLEYAAFDPIYSTTGIMPSMTRFEKLSSGLQSEPQRSPGSWIGLPRLLGYYEDMEQSRLGLVYQFPTAFSPVSFENLTQNPLNSLCSLRELLANHDFEPRLEAKFRLASNLANTVFDLHARGITHGNLVDSNVSFCHSNGVESATNSAEVDVRRPLISSFDLFPDSPLQDAPSTGFSLYRHPLDPRATPTGQSPLVANADPKVFDLYSLAMLLLSIGLWSKLENLVPHPASTSVSESILNQLSIRCGTLYMKAVQACWTAVEKELSGQLTGDAPLAKVQLKASRYLEACCILDGVSNLEERLSDDLGDEDVASRVRAAAPAVPPQARDVRSIPSSSTEKSAAAPIHVVAPPVKPEALGECFSAFKVCAIADTKTEKVAPHKTRLYPQIPLPPEAVEQWNRFLMPQINQALRHFYRKHRESVEISLESIGESPRETRPTVLVVCTSVAKVRAILKRKLGTLFDGTTGFALKVCRGQVLRSRKRGGTPRSMANVQQGEEQRVEITAANGAFQERPQNGASIGAWIGDRHLPPVTFGGLVMIDDKPYGMTVHHMLDDPDAEDNIASGDHSQWNMRSSGRDEAIEDLNQSLQDWYADLQSDTSAATSDDEFACEFSDSESDGFSESDLTSEASDAEDDDDDTVEPGDTPGVEPGCGDGYYVTQPALDDVEEGFYPNLKTQDEDHLDSFGLGEVYASSGIRRRSDDNGLIHEIDWALFEFKNHRLPDQNSIPRFHPSDGAKSTRADNALHPTTVAPTAALPGLEVQCIARTSGLQTGLILPAITSVKIYGRSSASHTYQISGTATSDRPRDGRAEHRPLPMGIPGDSGAWIVERAQGRLCGHVLAWSQRKKVAYICPMDVLLLDIAETLEAAELRLPGGDAVVSVRGTDDADGQEPKQARRGRRKGDEKEQHDDASVDEGYGDDDLGDLVEEEEDEDEAHRRLRLGLRDSGLGESPVEERGAAAGNSSQGRRCSPPGEDLTISGELARLRLGGKSVQMPC